jgi:hypothetical protein
VAHRLARELHVSLGRGGSKLRGSGVFYDAAGARQGGEMSHKVLISLETSPQGSGGMEFVVRVASD